MYVCPAAPVPVPVGRCVCVCVCVGVCPVGLFDICLKETESWLAVALGQVACPASS